jgi:hypothetical protein
MQQPLRLTRTTQIGAKTERFAFKYRWMHAFFTDNRSPGNVKVIELQRRGIWIGLALLCQTLASIPPVFSFSQIAQRAWYALPLEAISSLLPLGLTLGGFVAMWLAIKPATVHQQYEFIRQHGARWQRTALLRTMLLLVVGLVFCVLIVVQLFLPPAYSNDGTSLDTNAAQLLLAGKNPYTDSNILDVARRFAIQPTWTTPLRVGQFADMLDYPSEMDFRSAFDTALKADHAPEFESKVSYPALSFLTLVPIAFFKLGSVVPFYILSYILLAWKAARDELKPWLLLLALANVPMLGEVMGGSLDILYTLLIVLAWLWRDKRWPSALLLGLAIASKQTVWFFVPFYAILVLRQYGFREACLRLTVAGSMALAINLPFIIWNPAAWLSGVLAPLADPMFPLGVGIVSLSSYHLLPYLPSSFYLGLEGSAMVAMLIYYWRICRTCPEAAMFLAIVPLFLAWRSLPSYFCTSAFPLFVLMIAKHKADSAQKDATRKAWKWRVA